MAPALRPLQHEYAGTIGSTNPWHWKNDATPSLPRRSSNRSASPVTLSKFSATANAANASSPRPPTFKDRRPMAGMAVPNFSRVLSMRNAPPTMDYADPSLDLPALRSAASKSSAVRRFNGQTRTISEWDGLRKDPELWIEDGDCLVHLYGKGKSRRGAAFRVRADLVRASQCSRLLSGGFHSRSSSGSGSIESFMMSESGSVVSDSGYSSQSSADGNVNIFIPAIDDTTRSDAFSCHLATRNLFAWMLDRPLVGHSLGSALIDLLDRMLLVRPATVDNVQECLEYAERQGYMALAHSPDYALAMLRFAEHFQIWELWVDAFSHCVGMNDSLSLSVEFEHVSRVTKALITRSSLEMDLHLGRVTRALSNFLEDELSPSFLGLSTAERSHMDRFRSFIHSFYVAKYGYWPPPSGFNFDKELLRSLCDEFLDLYDYLADEKSSDSMTTQSSFPSGGICVLQNVNAFNERHNYEPLPHPLPLLPRYDDADRRPSSRGWKAFKSSRATPDSTLVARAALLTASNDVGPEIENSPIVQAYIAFEHQSLTRQDEKLSMIDARKTRWIFIYSTLQMLVSVTKAPDGVRDSVTPSYHMCCLVTESPPWQGQRKNVLAKNVLAVHPALRSFEPSEDEMSSQGTTPSAEVERSHSPMSIHPDCEEEEDYFGHHSRNASTSSFSPSPLKLRSAPVTRTSSIMSLSRRFSRRASNRGSVSLTTQSVNDLLNNPSLDTSQMTQEGPIPESTSDDGLSPPDAAQLIRTPTLDCLSLGEPTLDESNISPLDFAAPNRRAPSPLTLDTSHISPSVLARSQSLMSAFSATTVDSSSSSHYSSSNDEDSTSSNGDESMSSVDGISSGESATSYSPSTPVSAYRWSLSANGSPTGAQGEKRVGFVLEDSEVENQSLDEGLLPAPLEVAGGA